MKYVFMTPLKINCPSDETLQTGCHFSAYQIIFVNTFSLFQHTYNNDTEEEFTGYIPLGN